MRKAKGNLLGSDFEAEQQNLQLLELYPPFRDWVMDMRKKYGIATLYEKGIEGYAKWEEDEEECPDEHWLGTNKLRDWHEDIESGLLRFRLAGSYHEAVCYYVVTDSFAGARTSKINITSNRKGIKSVTIKLYACISKEEALAAFARANSLMRLTLKNRDGKIHAETDRKKWQKDKLRTELERDIELYRLSLTKNTKDDSAIATDRDVAARIFANEDVPLESLGDFDREKAKLISNARRRLEKEMERRFGVIISGTKKR